YYHTNGLQRQPVAERHLGCQAETRDRLRGSDLPQDLGQALAAYRVLRSTPAASVRMLRRPRSRPTSSSFSPMTLAMPTCPVTDVATSPRPILIASPREECASFRVSRLLRHASCADHRPLPVSAAAWARGAVDGQPRGRPAARASDLAVP